MIEYKYSIITKSYHLGHFYFAGIGHFHFAATHIDFRLIFESKNLHSLAWKDSCKTINNLGSEKSELKFFLCYNIGLIFLYVLYFLHSLLDTIGKIIVTHQVILILFLYYVSNKMSNYCYSWCGSRV